MFLLPFRFVREPRVQILNLAVGLLLGIDGSQLLANRMQ